MTLMRCKQCGTPQEPGERFCRECGRRFPDAKLPSTVAAPSDLPSTTFARVGKCPLCGAGYAAHERFCGQCGAVFASAPPVAEPTLVYPGSPPLVDRPPAAAPRDIYQTPPQPVPQLITSAPRPKSAWRIPVGIVLVLSLIIGIISLAGQVAILGSGQLPTSDLVSVVTTLLVISCFVFSFSLALLFPKVSLLYLVPSLGWVGLGLLSVLEVLGKSGFWGDWIFATGLSNLAGGIFGLLVALIARTFAKT